MTIQENSISSTEISTIPLAQLIVILSKRFNISEVIISPGSRSAPLIKSFVADSFFNTYSIIDERAAGFFALGIAQQIQRPVLLICTSGSAVLNYYPSIAEAFYSHRPIIVISADRLPFKIDIGDGQVIRQDHVLKQHTIGSYILKPDIIHGIDTILQCPHQRLIPKDSSQQDIESIQQHTVLQNFKTLIKAFQLVSESNQPIHINAPFTEPLYQMTKNRMKLPEASIESPSESVDNESKNLVDQWYQYANRWVLIGVLNPKTLNQNTVRFLENDPQTVVFTETTSNVHGTNFIYSIDSLMFPLELSKNTHQINAPDIVLTIGGMIVSKKIKAYLRELKSLKHWHLGDHTANNTFYCLEHHIKCQPNQFFESLSSSVQTMNQKKQYKTDIFNRFSYFQKLGNAFIKKLPLSDLKVFDLISKSIPSSSQVHFSNSATIRYAQLFQWDSSISIFCNRGASGIEGSTSVAIGASLKSKSPTVLMTGDLSFFYDANGLWNNYTRSDFRIIIINNQGGGIFRILPTESKDTLVFDKFIEAVHHRSAQYLAKDHGFEYHRAQDLGGLRNILDGFYETSTTPKILEIITPRKINDLLLLDYFKVMAEKEYTSKKYLNLSS
ncbi:MAG: thiamine pyrophosphate-binding protein [Flavobacteriaceae bacterium]|nr:thiamine pyrophosphate-binding protein [Flavobacteriaceae bacterium]MCY4267930.1 thiamine pyrophosphate-binding protein [Flavobacteriaceae bacterium]